jgi:hypothetical protein
MTKQKQNNLLSNTTGCPYTLDVGIFDTITLLASHTLTVYGQPLISWPEQYMFTLWSPENKHQNNII